MKFLVLDKDNTICDVKETLKQLGISFDSFEYQFEDINHDDFFEEDFSKRLKEGKYDAVFSINFFPLISKCCHIYGIKYLSWCCDNTLKFSMLEDTLDFETNYIFLFDKIEAKKYTDKGFKTVFYMPLCVNTKRLDKIRLSKTDIEKYGTDISFVGDICESDLQKHLSQMNDYQKGYIQAMLSAQNQLYGCFLFEDCIPNDFYPEREALIYSMAMQTTKEEQLLLLALLSSQFSLDYYSREANAFLSKGNFKGPCEELEQIPRVFKASKLNLNINPKNIQSGITKRCMDILGAGGLLFSSWQQELSEYFSEGEEVVMFGSAREAYEKADFYLSHETERERIARNGYQKVKEKFSYKNALEAMLSTAEL